MCGLCGLYNLDGAPAPREPVSAMRDRLDHRGPDDSGFWSEGPIALGFRRLSILDISGGRQPMVTPDGRIAVVFNGEIYNHPELKAELESDGVIYRTRSDTETLLHLYRRHGVEMFCRLNGMFAVALWDAQSHELILARDPIGIKPLYYSFEGKRILFASELRALLAAPAPDALEPSAVLEYLHYGCVRGSRTVVASVKKLPPGHLLRVNSRGIHLERHWEIPPLPHPSAPLGAEEALSQVESLLTHSVRRQLLSDVPVGAFLSGGLDSSLVAALMCRAAGRSIATFTIGFSGARDGLDESAYAKAVSSHLGAEHHELILPADVLDRMEDMVSCLDEPIADSAILPTFLLARFARERVKVVLSGEGADELFAGYGRYKAAYLSETISELPGGLGPVAAVLARRLGKGRVFRTIPHSSVRDWGLAFAQLSDGALKDLCAADFLESAKPSDPVGWFPEGDQPHTLNRALAYDLRTTLCDALLMKVDKATMRASLEARVPYLDKHLVQAVLPMPAMLKMRWFKGKYILRRLASKYLPREIVWRRKHGFNVAWEEWVRGPGNGRIDDIISGGGLEKCGVFRMDQIRRMRRRLIEGGRDVDAGLFFRIVIMGLWLESVGSSNGARA